MKEKSKYCAIIIDDDYSYMKNLSNILKKYNFQVDNVQTYLELVYKILFRNYDFYFININKNIEVGLGIVKLIHNLKLLYSNNNKSTILMSENLNSEVKKEIRDFNMSFYIRKNILLNNIQKIIKYGINKTHSV